MKISTTALILGSALLTCAAGAGLAACSSSSSTGEPSPQGDSGAGADTSMSNPDTGSGGDDSSTGDDGGTDGCADPPELFVSGDAGFYCPYSKDYNIDGGTYAYCATGTQTCCLSPSTDAGISTCEAVGSCPTGFNSWQCAGPEDCVGAAGGGTCCLVAGATESDSKCAGHLKTKGFDFTACVASPSACTGTYDAGQYIDNEFVVCQKDDDCGDAGSCLAIKTSGSSIGICSQ